MKKQKEIEEDMNGLIAMYQAGFIDGSGKKWKDIKGRVKKSFELRFIKKIGQQVQERKK